MLWLISDRDDPDSRRLVDGEIFTSTKWLGRMRPHYSRQTPGARLWSRNGHNLVFMTADNLSVFGVHRPAPGTGAVRQDGRDAWENTMFRNENGERRRRKLMPILSSDLIREAVALTYAIWGAPPPDGLITFVRADVTRRQRSANSVPGQCYVHAGWQEDRPASDGKPCLRAPAMESIPHWSEWSFKSGRGGVWKTRLEARQQSLDLECR